MSATCASSAWSIPSRSCRRRSRSASAISSPITRSAIRPTARSRRRCAGASSATGRGPMPSARAPRRRGWRCPTARSRAASASSLCPTWRSRDAARTGLIDVGRTVITPAECDERGEFLPHHQFGRYSDGAPLLWNHLGFDRAAMQEREEGSVVVEMLNHYRRPLRAGDLLVVMSGLAVLHRQGADLHPLPVRGRDRHACCLRRGRRHEVRPEDPQDHDVHPGRPGAARRAQAPPGRLRRFHGRQDTTAAGIARDLQGLNYDDKRLAEIAAEVEVLNDAVRKAAAARLTFDDEPAAFASLMAREAK